MTHSPLTGALRIESFVSRVRDRSLQRIQSPQSNTPGPSSRLRCMMAFLLGATVALGPCSTICIADAAQAQTGAVRVEVVRGAVPVAGATVSAAGQSATTDASGLATLALPAGPVSVIITKDGYETATVRVDVVAGGEHAVRLVLTAAATAPHRQTVVASTRTRAHVDEQAVPVKVLGRAEIEENMLRTPGNIATSLDEIGGLRLQTTSPELGLATIRMHGLRGQYTRLLSDGVPLYFDIPLGLGPVQIPPMDLDRVEVITEGASALFGANALAGVVNLLSRPPGKQWNREVLFSQSTPDATDGVVWLASPSTGSWSHTFLASAHRQDEKDLDDDGWSDIPGYSRGVARERVFWNNGRGKAVSGTAGVTFEKRKGGSEIAHQEIETKIADGALFAEMPVGRYVVAAAGSLYVQSRVRDFVDAREHDRRQAATLEIALRGSAPRQTWVAGIDADWFAIRIPEPEPLASSYVAPRGGIFIHDDVRIASWLLVSGSGRFDYTKGANDALRVDDFFFSPRGSLLAHKGPWGARISAGRSYFVPTALTEETEAAGFTRLSIDSPLEVETARSMSADLSYKTGAAEVTVTVFDSHIDDPAVIDRATYTLRTDEDPNVTRGVEILGRGRRAPFSLTGTYMYLRAREGDDRDVALTPRHSAGLIAAAEGEGRGRIAVRVSYSGVQRLDANPYRLQSEPYVLLGLLGEHRFGHWRVFVNADNLTDVRQTDWDPIARPTRAVDGRWTVDAWAPLRGRTINLGLRVSF
jgi:outer membrane receptor for ferrienterochelin and colicins